MPYVLIPDGYSLKKVTKAQKQAVTDKRRHDDVVALIQNPELIKQIIITGAAFLIAKEGKEALQDLKDLGVNVSQDVEDAYTKKRQFGDAPVGVSFEQIVEATFQRFGLGGDK
jgi:hypothetical protein